MIDLCRQELRRGEQLGAIRARRLKQIVSIGTAFRLRARRLEAGQVSSRMQYTEADLTAAACGTGRAATEEDASHSGGRPTDMQAERSEQRTLIEEQSRAASAEHRRREHRTSPRIRAASVKIP